MNSMSIPVFSLNRFIAVDLQQMGYRTDARIRLGRAGFSTCIKVQKINASSSEIVNIIVKVIVQSF